jgi:hypothetical protein
MSIVKGVNIVSFFKLLNKYNINYVLLRNINNEIPNKLKEGKDIDLLMRFDERDNNISFLEENGFRKLKHPHRNNIYLYGVNKFEFYQNKLKVLIDVNYQVACRSIDAGQWIPLDQEIQESIWLNKRFVENKDGLSYWTLSFEDEFVTLITRCIFDKEKFEEFYINRINELVEVVKLDKVMSKFKLIYFKFSSRLISLIKEKEFDHIINEYLSFKEY